MLLPGEPSHWPAVGLFCWNSNVLLAQQCYTAEFVELKEVICSHFQAGKTFEDIWIRDHLPTNDLYILMQMLFILLIYLEVVCVCLFMDTCV